MAKSKTQTHTQSVLDRKCIEIEDRLEDYHRRREADQAALIHLRATIALLQGDGTSEEVVPMMSVARFFQRGEIYTRCVQALEKAGTNLNTRELADYCLMSKGLAPDDRQLKKAMMAAITSTIHNVGDKEIVPVARLGALRIWGLRGRKQVA